MIPIAIANLMINSIFLSKSERKRIVQSEAVFISNSPGNQIVGNATNMRDKTNKTFDTRDPLS